MALFVALPYILAIIFTFILLCFVLYQVNSFDELENDHGDVIQKCVSMNSLVLPEYGMHGLLVLIFLLCFEWLTVIINLPLLAYHVQRYAYRPVMSVQGLYDPTTIMKSSELKRGMKEGWIKLAFYMITLFYYLYSMIYLFITQ